MPSGGGAAGRPALCRARRWGGAAVVAAALWGAVMAAAPAGAQAGAADVEGAFAMLIAAERQTAGRAPLAVHDDLVATARRHSTVMAAQSRLHHNPSLAQDVQGWVKVGENVGMGSGVDAVHAALMASSTHRSEILDPAFTDVGVGVVWSNGVVWVTQVFRQPDGAPGGAPSVAPQPPAPAPLASGRADAAPPARAVAATTSTTSTTTPSTTTTSTTTAVAAQPLVPAPPPVDLAPVAVAASAPLPVRAGVVGLGTMAAFLLWSVVAGLARQVIRQRLAWVR